MDKTDKQWTERRWSVGQLLVASSHRQKRRGMENSHVWNFPKFSENYKITSPSSSTNRSTEKHEENDLEAHHKEAAQKAPLANLS